MIIKHSDWELGAYLYEYNGETFNNVSNTNPITLLSETFFSNCTKSYINKKFFYFDLSKDTYFLKCNVEFNLRFYVSIRTELNNTVYTLIGYYLNPLQLKTKAIQDLASSTTANVVTAYKSGIYTTNIPIWIAEKDSSFFLGLLNNDSFTFYNNINSVVWKLMVRQI